MSCNYLKKICQPEKNLFPSYYNEIDSKPLNIFSDRANDNKYEVALYDDYKYISKPDSSGNFKWIKITGQNTPEEYNEQFLNTEYYLEKKYKFPSNKIRQLEIELNENDILYYHIEWDGIYNYIDTAWGAVEYEISKSDKFKQLKKQYPEDDDFKILNRINMVFITDKNRFYSEINGKIYFYHNLNKNASKIVDEIFKKLFGENYIWNGKNGESIAIYMGDALEIHKEDLKKKELKKIARLHIKPIRKGSKRIIGKNSKRISKKTSKKTSKKNSKKTSKKTSKKNSKKINKK